MAERVATIRPIPSTRGDTLYAVAYTVDGRVAMGSVARPTDLDELRRDLAEAGWRLVEADGSGEAPCD
ncbi:hypothetical protein NOGI109294_10050 [Nocardiopsis gilva]|nr:hypothetical protein [Nocardiopsis gilva]